MKQYDEAFSGLEAAIVIIAFVIIAVVFGMAVISSGFFATQEAEKTTTSGYKMASSSIYIEGTVYAYLLGGYGTKTALDDVQFSAVIPETGQAQDLNELIIVYTHSKDSSIVREFTYGGVTADSEHFGVDGSPVMLPGERRNFRLDDVNGPIPGGWFTIEFKPKVGASTFVTYHISDSFQGGSILT